MTVVCKSIQKIEIHEDKIVFVYIGQRTYTSSTDVLNDFAREDGFTDWSEMRDWFDKMYGLPLIDMCIIYW